jgi:hypothetical protein
MSTRNWTEDRDYFEHRARQERRLAIQCEDNAAALAHLRMAEAYDQRVNHPRSQGSSGASSRN